MWGGDGQKDVCVAACDVVAMIMRVLWETVCGNFKKVFLERLNIEKNERFLKYIADKCLT